MCSRERENAVGIYSRHIGQNCLVSDWVDRTWTKKNRAEEKGATEAASRLNIVLSIHALATRLCVSEREPTAHLLHPPRTCCILVFSAFSWNLTLSRVAQVSVVGSRDRDLTCP